MTIYKIEAGFDEAKPYITYLRPTEASAMMAKESLEADYHKFGWVRVTQSKVDKWESV